MKVPSGPHGCWARRSHSSVAVLWVQSCPPQRNVQVLTPGTCARDRTWKQAPCSYRQIKMTSYSEWALIQLDSCPCEKMRQRQTKRTPRDDRGRHEQDASASPGTPRRPAAPRSMGRMPPWSPQGNAALPTPQCCTSHLQVCEEINFCRLRPSSLRSFVTAALAY